MTSRVSGTNSREKILNFLVTLTIKNPINSIMKSTSQHQSQTSHCSSQSQMCLCNSLQSLTYFCNSLQLSMCLCNSHSQNLPLLQPAANVPVQQPLPLQPAVLPTPLPAGPQPPQPLPVVPLPPPKLAPEVPKHILLAIPEEEEPAEPRQQGIKVARLPLPLALSPARLQQLAAKLE